MPTKEPTRSLLSTRMAAALLQIPAGTLSNWRLRNVGPSYFKIEHAVRYDLEDLNRWINRNRVDPQEEA